MNKGVLFPATVLKWQLKSWRMVPPWETAGVSYLLNTNRLDSIRETNGGLDTTMYYFINPDDHRDNGDYMVLNETLDALKIYMDSTPTHNSVTLDIFPDNDITQTAVSTEIPTDCIALAVGDTITATHSWVVYISEGFKVKQVLVDHLLIGILAQTL
jgi:hypothetical protein